MLQTVIPTNSKEILLYILSNWEKLNLPKVNKNELKPNILPFRKFGLHSHLSFMFKENDRPIIVVKFPRYKSLIANESILHEKNIIDLLNKTNIKDNLPKIFKLITLNDTPIIIYQAYEGKMVNQIIDIEENPDKITQIIEDLINKLIDFNLSTKGQIITIDTAFYEKYITTPLNLIYEFYPEFIKDIDSRVNNFLSENNCLGETFSSVCLHNEYNPWNILMHNSLPIILDWEDAKLNSFPALDLYNLLIISHRILMFGEQKETKDRSIDQVKVRAKLIVDILKNNVLKYQKAIGLSQKVFDFLYLVFAINQLSLFLNQKRRSIEYSKYWISPLLNFDNINCFSSHLEKEVAVMLKEDNK